MHQNAFGGRYPPKPTMGAYSTPQAPGWIKEKNKKEGNEWEEKGGSEMGGRGKGYGGKKKEIEWLT